MKHAKESWLIYFSSPMDPTDDCVCQVLGWDMAWSLCKKNRDANKNRKYFEISKTAIEVFYKDKLFRILSLFFGREFPCLPLSLRQIRGHHINLFHACLHHKTESFLLVLYMQALKTFHFFHQYAAGDYECFSYPAEEMGIITLGKVTNQRLCKDKRAQPEPL